MPASRYLNSRTVRQPQIQALRAIAVLSVIVYHFWPVALPGGYVGVDVFFAISGYLMTKSILHLRTEMGGRLGPTMREFYSRRLARILPAALLTLLTCAVLVLFILPTVSWDKNLDEILASTFFVENWRLAATATDYLGSTTGSAVQNFWSLSVEEQFYVVWPLLVFFAAKSRLRLTARGKTTRLLLCFGGLTALSLAYSIHETATHASTAYFNTGTRFWELSFGAVAFVIDRDLGLPARARALAGWLGLALIAYALVTYSENTVFPGWRAGVPVVGAALVIFSSPHSSAWGPGRVLSVRPLQWIGDISYSMYLIHWPVLILATEATASGTDLSTVQKLVFIPCVLLASALLKREVEDRFRRSNPVGGQPRRGRRRAAAPGRRRPAASKRSTGFPIRRTISLIVSVQIALLVLTIGGLKHKDALIQQANASAQTFDASNDRQASCYSAISKKQSSSACPQVGDSITAAVPSPLTAKNDWPYGRCQERGDGDAALRCDLAKATNGTVVVAGDSHVTQWLPAILPWAAGQHLSVTTFLKSGCPLTDSATWGKSCQSWNQNVLVELQKIKPAFIITSADSALNDGEITVKADNLVSRWRLLSASSTLIALRDIPQPYAAGIGSVPACLMKSQSVDKCSFSLTVGLHRDLVLAAAKQVPAVRTIDMGSYFCPDSKCMPIINGILVWIDNGHMSSYFATGLSAALSKKLDAAIR